MPEPGHPATDARPFRVAIVGAGPRGTSIAHRVSARAPMARPGRQVEIHVVEPLEPGAGSVWRTDGPRQLLMNSPVGSAGFLAAGPGGPPVPGLGDWLAGHPGLDTPPAECAGFAPRSAVGSYLKFIFGRLDAGAESVRVVVHRGRARRLRDLGTRWGPQVVDIDGGGSLVVDAVVLAQGHLPVGPPADEEELAGAARRDGWSYLPTGPADIDRASMLRPGRPVAVRGFGLTAVDLLAILTEGRGGRFVARRGDRLRYLASGQEPVIHIGSRTGRPYRAKPPSQAPAVILAPPDFLTESALAGRATGSTDFRAEIWPLIQADVTAAYYRHVRRLGKWSGAVAFGVLLSDLHRTGPESPTGCEIVSRAVRDRRFHFPPDWWGPDARDGVVVDVATAVRRDLRQPRSPDFPARLAARAALVRAAEGVAALDRGGRFSGESVARDLLGWFGSLSNSLTSGPPRGRLQQLLALSDAGVVRFVGPGMGIESNRSGAWVTGRRLPRPIPVAAFAEARLTAPDLCRTLDPLVRHLLQVGGCHEVIVGGRADRDGRHTGCLGVDPDHRLLDAAGRPHPRRWAAGPSVRTVGAGGAATLSMPVDTDDAIARAVLVAAEPERFDGSRDVFASSFTAGVTTM